MAGRGRGRGRGMSFSVESLGFSSRESLPGPILQPPPVFPPLEFKPVPLETGEEWDYLLALKQEYRGTMKDSPYYVKPTEKKRDIERYSDKYQLGQQENGNSWHPDWTRLPAELKIKTKRKARLKTAVQPNLTGRAGIALKPEDIQKHLETLAEKEAVQGDESEEEEEGKEKKENEEEIEEDIYDEEDLEEETDYNLNYFDNGENFGMGDEDDDMDDGPIY